MQTLVDILFINYGLNIFLGVLTLIVSMSLGRLLLQYDSGYQPLSPMFAADQRTGFNTVYRIVFAPIAIVGVSIALYFMGRNELITNIWTTAFWFFAIQALLLVSLGRWSLIDKFKFFAYHSVSILISIFLYYGLIIKGLEHLLPDEANLRSDIWVAIALFLYGIFNSVRSISDYRKFMKHLHYTLKKYKKLRDQFKSSLEHYDLEMQRILLAIMIYEDFNRPWLIRQLEYMFNAKTKGIMQASGAKNDKDSIKIAAMRIKPYYDEFMTFSKAEEYHLQKRALTQLFSSYNPFDNNYSDEVMKIYDHLKKPF